MARNPHLYDRYKEAKKLDDRDPEIEPSVYVLWGPTDSGKTRTAFEVCNDWSKTNGGAPYFIRSGQKQEWMSGYQGEMMILMDEFNWRDFDINILKSWLDRYPGCKVAGKLQAYVPLKASYWVITCQDRPSDWYNTGHVSLEDRKAVMRRLTSIKEFKSEGKEVKELVDMEIDRTVTPPLPESIAEVRNEEDRPRQMEQCHDDHECMDVIDLSGD